MANEVRLNIGVDSQQAERAFKRAAASATEAGQAVQAAAKRFDDLAEAWDRAETRAQGFRDGVTGVQDSMASLSAFAQGDFQNGLLLAGSGIADLSSSLANTLIPWAQKTVTTLGVLRLSLLGVAGVAAIAAFAFISAANDANRFEADLTHAQEDLDRFIATGRRTVFIRQVFGDATKSTEEWADAIEKAQATLTNTSEWRLIWANITGEAHAVRQQFEAIDQATAEYIDRTGDAAGAERMLREEMSDALYVKAVAAGLLDKTQAALARNTERQWDQAKSVKATAAAYREAAKELTTFTDLILAQTNPIFGLINAKNRLEDAELREIEAIQQYGAESVQAQRAAWERRAAELALVDAIARTASVNKEELIPTLQQLADQGLISQDAVRAIANAADLAEEKLRELDGTRVTINIEYAQRILKPVGQLIAGFRAGGPAGLIRALMSFHDGGVVPGPAGQEVAAILQAGERVVPLGGDTGQQITLVLQSGGSELDDLLVRLVARSVRAAGGNVQTVLGW